VRVEIHYDFTIEDYSLLQTNYFLKNYKPTYLNLKRFAVGFISIGAIFLGAIIPYFLLVALGLALLGYAIFNMRNKRKELEKQVKLYQASGKLDSLIGHKILHVLDKGVRLVDDNSDCSYYWKSIKGLKELNTFIVLELDFIIIAIPKRAFADHVSEKQLIEKVKEKLLQSSGISNSTI
jgi:hypothetical protein